MVLLTAELMAKSSSGYTKKKKEESAQNFVKRLTHLYLENKSITDVSEDMAMCRNLVVLYLYDNQLTEVPCLNFNCNLTHLYLQNNHITKITNLSALTKLSKLYLGGNCLTVVEGLEQLEQLQELHVENQHLPPGEQLLFDPRSLQALSGHLEVLNVSGNNLESLSDLRDLRGLTQLFAADNQLTDMRELSLLLAAWSRLWRLELVGNPLCHKPKYKDRIIVMCRKLEMLDGKEITDTARQFLRNWHETRETNKKKRDEFSRQQSFLTEGINRIGEPRGHELPPVSAPNQIVSGISGYLMPGLPRKEFEEILARTNSGDSRIASSSKQRSGMFRANAPNGYGAYRKPTVSSAPLRHKPLMSITLGLYKNGDIGAQDVPL